jgi:PAS domain S-box-containing protein
MHRDKLAFSFAASLTTAWSGLYFLAWVLGIVPRGWSGGVIYGLLALMIVTISTWPEPVTYNPHDASPNTIVTVTPDGIVTSWQGAGPSMFGWLAAEIVGQPSSVLMPERFRAAHETGLARVRATGVSELARIPLVLTAMHRDGSEFPVRMFLTVATGRDGLAITAVIGRP